MSKTNATKHAYWKRWGWSVTCSECGYVGFDSDYCPKCGARMDLPEVWEAPEIHLPKMVAITCPKCYKVLFGVNNYCPYCGAKMDEVTK